ncbi:phosphatidylinositol-specific phospholipase C domain-containing protein [Streptomyces sp. CO7]
MSHPLLHRLRVASRRRLGPLAQLVAGCVAASSLMLASAPAQAAGSVNADAYNSLGSAPLRQDWMKSLDGATPLSRVSLPGTHDTLSIHGGSSTETQQDYGDSAATLTAQLDRGIRALDIRVRVTENQYFTVHHGVFYQNANFDDVLTKAKAFLAQHPGETIVMRLKAECPIGSGGGIGECTNDPSNVSAGVIATIFDQYAKKYDGLFHKPSITRNSLAPTPTLSQVRGRIVLGTFDVTEKDGSASYSYGTNGFHSHLVDDWKPSDDDAKFEGVRRNVDAAIADKGNDWYVSYTSATSALLSPSPAEWAGGYIDTTAGVTTYVAGQNIRLMNHLNNSVAPGRIGIVMMDFPGWALIQNIVDRNKGDIVKGSHQGLWLVNADKTYVNTKYGRCLVRGPEFDSSRTGGLVTQRACQSTPPVSHQWQAEQPSSFDHKGYFWIKASNGTCLTVPYNNGTPPSAGTQLFWWGCETRWFSGSQMWNIVPTKVEVAGSSRTAYAFVNQWTGLCMAVDPATATVAGGPVTQDVCPK